MCMHTRAREARSFSGQQYFEERGGVMNGMEAMELLQAVSQEPTERKTSNTQWSAVYDLQKKCLRVCVGRHYDRVFDLSNE